MQRDAVSTVVIGRNHCVNDWGANPAVEGWFYSSEIRFNGRSMVWLKPQQWEVE